MEYPEVARLTLLWSVAPWVLFTLWICLRIFRKAGLSGWWTVLMVIPIVNVAMLWVFSFMRWPGLEAAQTRQAGDIFS